MVWEGASRAAEAALRGLHGVLGWHVAIETTLGDYVRVWVGCSVGSAEAITEPTATAIARCVLELAEDALETAMDLDGDGAAA